MDHIVNPSFGTQSLRLSDAITSGSFGDQAFAKPLVNSVGETVSTNGSFSAETKYSHFKKAGLERWLQ